MPVLKYQRILGKIQGSKATSDARVGSTHSSLHPTSSLPFFSFSVISFLLIYFISPPRGTRNSLIFDIVPVSSDEVPGRCLSCDIPHYRPDDGGNICQSDFFWIQSVLQVPGRTGIVLIKSTVLLLKNNTR